jgi:hypothetical protein
MKPHRVVPLFRYPLGPMVSAVGVVCLCLSLAGGAAEAVRIRLQIASGPDGPPLTTVRVGESFWVSAYVQDVYVSSATLAGVFATYLNVQYDAGRVSASDGFVFSPSYPNGRKGTIAVTQDSGVVVGVGSFHDFTTGGPGREEFWQFSIAFRANAEGAVSFVAAPATGTGEEVLLYEYPGSVVAPTDISFVSASLTIARLQITQARYDGDAALFLAWAGATSGVYVEWTLSLSPDADTVWQTLAGPLAGTNTVLTPTPDSRAAFLRLRVN